MQASQVDQRRLLDIADLDRAIAQATHRRSHLPELAELATLGAQRNAVTGELVAAQTAISDLEAAQERLESDLEPARARRERNQAKVDAGQISDPKALQGMVEELEHLAQRIAKLEDDELELMQQIEDAGRVRDEVAARRAEIDTQGRALIAARDQAFSEIDHELAESRAARAHLAAQTPPELIALYDKVSARHGSGAAELKDDSCTGCHVQANAADLRRYRAAAVDEVVRCEECGRILVR